MNNDKISLCGDNCSKCPRYKAKTEDELKSVAELWYKVGFRNKIVSTEEISCKGCSPEKECSYNLIQCTKENNVQKCNECKNFTCDKINKMLERSKENQQRCKELCTKEEYEILHKAFFEKEINLKNKTLGTYYEKST